MTTFDLDTTEVSLEAIRRCFTGAVPAVLATVDPDLVPNVTYLSRAYRVDDHRLALSNQFMSKTSRNLATNPRASLLLIDPVSYDQFRLALVYERTERRGPVFERLRAEIDDLAALTGMQDVFRLRAADVFRVEEIVAIPPHPDSSSGHVRIVGRDPRRDLSAVAELAGCVARAADADVAIDVAFDMLDRQLGYDHVYLLLLDELGDRLYTVASRGYQQESLGAEVAVGEGQVGAVATRCEPITVSGLRQLAKYSRSVRRQFESSGIRAGCEPALPGLSDVESRIAVPAMSGGQLIGVLVAESLHRAAFDDDDERLLGVVATLLAGAVELARDDLVAPIVPAEPERPRPPAHRPAADATTVRFFSVDGSVFVDGEYLIKGVAGRILWSLLGQHTATGRTDFTNKELRLDPALALPGFKDNLESRLLLLRRRLDERRTPFRLVRTGRGRFRLEVGTAAIVLEPGDGPNAFADGNGCS